MAKIIHKQRINCEGFQKDSETGLIKLIDDKETVKIGIEFLDSGKTNVGCSYCLGIPKKCYKGGRGISEKFRVNCPYALDFFGEV